MIFDGKKVSGKIFLNLKYFRLLRLKNHREAILYLPLPLLNGYCCLDKRISLVPISIDGIGSGVFINFLEIQEKGER